MDNRLTSDQIPDTYFISSPKYFYRRRDAAFAGCSLALGWLFVRTFMFSGACLGAFVFAAAAAALGLFFLRASGRLTISSAAGGIITVLLALPMLFSPSWEMRSLAGVSAFVSYIIWITGSFSLMPRGDFGQAASVLSGVFVRPFSRFGDVFLALAGGIKNGVGKKLLTVLLGLIAAAPLAVIVMINLCSADIVFAGRVDNLLDSISDTIFVNIVSVFLGIFVAMYLFGLLSASRDAKAIEREPKRFIPAGFTLSLTIPLMICYTAFFAVQLPYYLSAFGGVLPDGYSFSEYAVSGFFELIRVAVINGAVCLVITVFADSKAVRRAVVTVLGVMTLILLSTAASKLYLYIDAYSLTRKRVYAGIALIFIAVFFIILILKQYINSIRLTAASLILCALFSVTMTFPDWDGVIAESMLVRVMDGKLSDLTEISSLSDSPKTVSCIISAYENGEWAASEAAKTVLTGKKESLRVMDEVNGDPTPIESVLSFNISEYRAKKMIREYSMLKLSGGDE